VTVEIQEERIRPLNEKDVREGDYVLYWMQEAQRAEYNHALEYAVQRANDLEQRLLVVFGLTEGCPEANLRHYASCWRACKTCTKRSTNARLSS
jgi:deoxyribodipyrimidine photo-lyase